MADKKDRLRRAQEMIKAECPDIPDAAFGYGGMMTVVDLHVVERVVEQALAKEEAAVEAALQHFAHANRMKVVLQMLRRQFEDPYCAPIVEKIDEVVNAYLAQEKINPGRDETMVATLNGFDLPVWLISAAEDISSYMAARNYQDWTVGSVQQRMTRVRHEAVIDERADGWMQVASAFTRFGLRDDQGPLLDQVLRALEDLATRRGVTKLHPWQLQMADALIKLHEEIRREVAIEEREMLARLEARLRKRVDGEVPNG